MPTSRKHTVTFGDRDFTRVSEHHYSYASAQVYYYKGQQCVKNVRFHKTLGAANARGGTYTVKETTRA